MKLLSTILELDTSQGLIRSGHGACQTEITLLLIEQSLHRTVQLMQQAIQVPSHQSYRVAEFDTFAPLSVIFSSQSNSMLANPFALGAATSMSGSSGLSTSMTAAQAVVPILSSMTDNLRKSPTMQTVIPPLPMDPFTANIAQTMEAFARSSEEPGSQRFGAKNLVAFQK